MTNLLTLNTDGSLLEVAPTVVSAGAASAGNIPALNSAGQLDPSIVPVTQADQLFAIAMAIVLG